MNAIQSCTDFNSNVFDRTLDNFHESCDVGLTVFLSLSNFFRNKREKRLIEFEIFDEFISFVKMM